MENNYYELEMKKEEEKIQTWANWEMEQLEKYDGEVFVEVVMSPIPWHNNNSRRYNIYNQNNYNDEDFKEIDIIIDCEIVEEDESFRIAE